MHFRPTDRERLIALNTILEISPIQFNRLLGAFPALEALENASLQTRRQAGGLTPQAAEQIGRVLAQQRVIAKQEACLADRTGTWILTQAESEYPALLGAIVDPPPVLYVRGSVAALQAPSVALVGSRRPSGYGIETAERLGYELALHGMTLISGLARGIDAAVHRGCLRAGGVTVAVVGSGLGRIYPPEHAGLAEAIARSGAVISEFPYYAAPLPHHFPRRNRIISGLSRAVVVIEAAARSGALITADQALEQGREVMAVPGQIGRSNSQGCHTLLQAGAKLVTCVEDILEEVGLVEAAGSSVNDDTNIILNRERPGARGAGRHNG